MSKRIRGISRQLNSIVNTSKKPTVARIGVDQHYPSHRNIYFDGLSYQKGLRQTKTSSSTMSDVHSKLGIGLLWVALGPHGKSKDLMKLEISIRCHREQFETRRTTAHDASPLVDARPGRARNQAVKTSRGGKISGSSCFRILPTHPALICSPVRSSSQLVQVEEGAG